VQSDTDRFLALVCRELGASEAHIVEDGETPSPPGDDGRGQRKQRDQRELRAPLAKGGTVVATFEKAPDDRQAAQQRLEMLASTFDVNSTETPPVRRSRPPAARSLRDELDALSTRAAASNAIVIDANSPILWGAAQALEDASILDTVRALPEIAALRKGKHVRCVHGSGAAPLVAHSFAGIYLLVLIFDAPFDELRAERAVLDALGRVERLVLALPPHDPDPTEGAGVVAMRRRR
jgi:hypothetical protein